MVYYYYTINKKGLLTIDTTSNIGLDSVEEANNFDSNVNILSFNWLKNNKLYLIYQ